MGENAIRISDGVNVKIGTNENLYYLRADQRSLVRRAERSLDIGDASILTQLRFRFPFPDEDKVAPGEFEDFNRALGVPGLSVPNEVEHGQVQFKADRGYLLMLPCPEGPDGKDFEAKAEREFHRNGRSGAVHIAMQRFCDGKLITLCKCGGCGVMFRLETLEDAQPIIGAMVREAMRTGRGYYGEVATRITRGYVECK